MKIKLLTLSLCLTMAATAICNAAPVDDLRAALQKFKNPTGTYVMQMHIPFSNIDPMNTTTTMNLQASPFKAKVHNVVSMGKQAPTDSYVYAEMSGNNVKTYSKEKLNKNDKTETWVYTLEPRKPGESLASDINPDSVLGSVKDVQLLSKSGSQEKLKVVFDCEKLFANWGIQKAITTEASSDKKTDEDFQKEFEKLRKSGTMDGEATIVNGTLTQFSANITKPVKAFENAIIKGVGRQSHTGAMGDWILGMIMKTGTSTMTITSKPLTEAVVIPQSVRDAAILKPATTK